jgi:hypothetical protein
MSKATNVSAAPAVQRRSDRPSGASRPPTRRPTSPLFYVFASLGILLGVLVIIMSLGFFIGSFVMVSVLNEIGVRSFDAPMERIGSYEVFFNQAAAEGFQVTAEEPKIDQGVTYYLWQVKPRGLDDICSFQWEHNLENNEVTPRNNAALLLDIKLQYVTEHEAGTKYDFYNPEDQLARAVVEEEFELLMTPNGDGHGWADRQQANLPPLAPPLLTPEEAKRRRGGGVAKPKTEEEIAAEEEAAATAAAEAAANGEIPPATDVQTPDGDSTEVGDDENGEAGEEDSDGEGQDVVQPEEDPELPVEPDPDPSADDQDVEEDEPAPPAEDAVPVG